MGISRDSLHKRRKTGGKPKQWCKKRKYELGRVPASTKLVSSAATVSVRRIRVRGGHYKFRALRLESGNFSWPSESVTKRTRVLDVMYNATSNELVRTQTLVKGAVIQIDATPFRLWYQQHYGVEVGLKKGMTTHKASREKQLGGLAGGTTHQRSAESRGEARWSTRASARAPRPGQRRRSAQARRRRRARSRCAQRRPPRPRRRRWASRSRRPARWRPWRSRTWRRRRWRASGASGWERGSEIVRRGRVWQTAATTRTAAACRCAVAAALRRRVRSARGKEEKRRRGQPGASRDPAAAPPPAPAAPVQPHGRRAHAPPTREREGGGVRGRRRRGGADPAQPQNWEAWRAPWKPPCA